MHALRDLIRELRPVLERLVHVDAITTHTSYKIKEVIQRMDRMEQGAQMAKEVRDEIARTLEKERSQYRRQGNRRDEN
jgi:ABC-type sulfate/molybdate transport systems ATPase subunit